LGGEGIDLLLAESGQTVPLGQIERATSVPLSFTQEGLWFLEQLGHTGPSYNALSPLRIRGPLDVEALCRAVEDLVQRHEILRTRFRVVDGTPTQVVTDRPARFEISESTDVDEIWRAHTGYRFDLEGEDLFRFEVARVGPEEHLVVIDAHQWMKMTARYEEE